MGNEANGKRLREEARVRQRQRERVLRTLLGISRNLQRLPASRPARAAWDEVIQELAGMMARERVTKERK